MPADDHDLLRILGAANFSDDIRGIHRPVGDAILDVDFQARSFASFEITLELFLIFGRHADDWNVVVRVKAERAGVGQMHSGSFSAALASDYRDGTGVVRCFQESRRTWRKLPCDLSAHRLFES